MGSIHVAVGVIQSPITNEVLLSLRQSGQSHAGLWEFPGGKLEKDEDVLSALRRELLEETGLIVDSARPFIKIKHRYPDQDVILDVWKVTNWSGNIEGREGQLVKWININFLRSYKLLPANYPIISAIQLSTLYLISPDLLCCDYDPIKRIKGFLDAGLKLFQLRCKDNEDVSYLDIATKLAGLFTQYNATLILNADPALVEKTGANGVHLNSERLMKMTERPLAKSFWTSASCHNRQELEHAESIDLDFVTLSPVKSTNTYPEAEPMGWGRFEELVNDTNMPVYALGGLAIEDLTQAWEVGAQGVAVISSVWNSQDAGKEIKKLCI